MSDQAVIKQEKFSVSQTDLSQADSVAESTSDPIEISKTLKLEPITKPDDSNPDLVESEQQDNELESYDDLEVNTTPECNNNPDFETIMECESENVEPIIDPKNLKLEQCSDSVEAPESLHTAEPHDFESFVEKPLQLPKNIKLEPYSKPADDANPVSYEPVVVKPIELPKNLKTFSKPREVLPHCTDTTSIPKPFELSKNVKLTPISTPIEISKNLTKPIELPKGFRIEPLPKPIELPKGFKIEPIPKHLEIPIPKPFQIDPVARNLEVPFSTSFKIDSAAGNLEAPNKPSLLDNHPSKAYQSKQPYRRFEGLRNQFPVPKRQKYNSKMVVETDHSKYTFPMQMTNPYDRENWTVSTDHCYARPWNWRPETTFLKPAKTLFIQKNIVARQLFCKAPPTSIEDEEIDVDSELKESTPMYDVEKAKKLMEECDKQAALMRGSMDIDWEEKINKTNWTPAQLRVFNGMVTVLNNYHLAKLSQSGMTTESIIRRTAIDKAVSRTRRLFATVSLDIKVLQWLHNVLLDNLDRGYLGDYLDILQTLKAKLPNFVDKMIHGSQRIGCLSIENLNNILKNPWDPVASSLSQDKPKKLPGGPIIILVPSGPVHTKRAHKWMLLLANLGNVVSVPTNFSGTGSRLTMTNCLDQLFALTRGRVQEMRETYPGKHIILVGFGAGATLAVQVAQVENVFCVVSLGFSMLTAEGRRGEPDDNLLELQCPVLFVIGQSSSTCFQEDLEDVRSRMRIETGLIVVGSADNNLIVSKRKRKEEGITQSIVDRCIIDEVGEFISGLILSPYPPQMRQSPTPVPEIVPKKTPKSGERKRYSSTMSDESEPPSPIPAPPLPRLSKMGRPPGAARIKSKLEAKWAAQIAQGTSSTSSPAPQNTSLNSSSLTSDSSAVITIDDESSDTASASDSVPVSPQTPQKPSTVVSPSKKGIILASKQQQIKPDTGGLIRQLLSSTKKIKTTKTLVTVTGQPVKKAIATGGGERSVKIAISSRKSEPARMQAYNLNRNLPLKGQLSTLLQGGIKTIPPVQNKTSTIKVLENVQLTGNATAKLISTATGRTIDLSKLSTVSNASSSGNVMLLPDGKIKTVQSVIPASSRGNNGPNSGSNESGGPNTAPSCPHPGPGGPNPGPRCHPNIPTGACMPPSSGPYHPTPYSAQNPYSCTNSVHYSNSSDSIPYSSGAKTVPYNNETKTVPYSINNGNNVPFSSATNSFTYPRHNPVSYSGAHSAHFSGENNPVPYSEFNSVPYPRNPHQYSNPVPYSGSHGGPYYSAPSNSVPHSVRASFPAPHPPPRYGRPLFPLPPMSYIGGLPNMRGPLPYMMKRPKFAAPSRRSIPSIVGQKTRPIRRHTYVPLPSQPLPPPTNLTSQDIMDLPIIFADDNQVIDTNVPTDLSTTGPSSQKKTKLVSSSTPTNKFVIVSKPSSASNFIINPSSVKRPMPMSMVKQQPPNKYAKIILSKKGMEENIRLNTVKLPPDMITKAIPQVEQVDLETELKASVLQKPKSISMKNITVLPRNATMEAFAKMEEAAVQEDDDPDYVPPKNLKL